MKLYNVTVQGTQVSESPLSYTEAKDKATDADNNKDVKIDSDKEKTDKND